MTLEMLERLEKNPHYTLSAKQKAELEKLRAQRPSIIAFGQPNMHNTTVEKHPTLKRRPS